MSRFTPKSGGFKTSWPPPVRVNPIAINNDWFKAEKLLPTHHAMDFSLIISKVFFLSWVMCIESFLFMWEIIGTRFWQSGVDHFSDEFFDGNVCRKSRNLDTMQSLPWTLWSSVFGCQNQNYIKWEMKVQNDWYAKFIKLFNLAKNKIFSKWFTLDIWVKIWI